MPSELLYQLALALVPNIGDVHARILLQHFGEASAIFKATAHSLEKLEGIGAVRAQAIRSFTGFAEAEKELAFLEKYKIQPLFFTDAAYPKRLLHCADAPALLFYKGSANLNSQRVLSVVGTRSNTTYGKAITETLIQDLAPHGVLVVSGLAFGIDAVAHKAALKNNLPTAAVVGHGLDKIYPAQHTGLAKEILQSGGGILTEFFSGTGPDKHNFPLRNRIVAGISDATVVVETDVKGGSMITAKLADAYNRDVFAVPGRTTDGQSKGCNHLIRNNKAILLTDAQQLLQTLGWEDAKKEKRSRQKNLFVEFSADEKQIVQLLQEKETVHIDELNFKSGLSSSAAAAAILNLELQNIVATLPGKLYKLI